MLDEEIYILTKHGKFQSEYIEKLPIYRRRHFLYLLNKEFEEIERQQNKIKNQSKFNTSRP
jgi:hypothetical protein